MPRRLLDLVKQYPFPGAAGSANDPFLPSPRFSTRKYDTLLIRIRSEKTADAKRIHPLDLLEDVMVADIEPESTAGVASLIEELRKANEHDGSGPTKILADESIQLLTLIPAEAARKLNPITMFSLPPEITDSRSRSASVGEVKPPVVNGSNPVNGASAVAAAAARSSPDLVADGKPAPDWQQFSTAGFGQVDTIINRPLALSLRGPVEAKPAATTPAPTPTSPPKRKEAATPKKKPQPAEPAMSPVAEAPPPQPQPRAVTIHHASVIQVDEAFIDFWSDSLLDPEPTAKWPTFTVCNLKNAIAQPAATGAGDNVTTQSISWVIIEHSYGAPAPPMSPVSERPASPSPSIQTDTTTRSKRLFGSLSPTKKRFKLFSSGSSSASTKSATKKGSEPAKEAIPEEQPAKDKEVAKEVTAPEAKTSHTAEIATTAAVAAGAAALPLAAQVLPRKEDPEPVKVDAPPPTAPEPAVEVKEEPTPAPVAVEEVKPEVPEPVVAPAPEPTDPVIPVERSQPSYIQPEPEVKRPEPLPEDAFETKFEEPEPVSQAFASPSAEEPVAPPALAPTSSELAVPSVIATQTSAPTPPVLAVAEHQVESDHVVAAPPEPEQSQVAIMEEATPVVEAPRPEAVPVAGPEPVATGLSFSPSRLAAILKSILAEPEPAAEPEPVPAATVEPAAPTEPAAPAQGQIPLATRDGLAQFRCS